MASQQTKLNARTRGDTGSGDAGRLRRNGLVPGVCYGSETDSVPLAFDPDDLRHILEGEQGQNTVFELDVDGEGSYDHVMVKDYQIDPVKRELLHVDLMALQPDREVEVKVPLSPEGTPEGEQEGGTLHLLHPEIEVVCRADAIPTSISIDVSELGPEDTLMTNEISFPEGVEPAFDIDFAVARIMMPREDVVGLLSPEELAAQEAEEAEEGEEGALEGEEEAAEEEGVEGEEAPIEQ